jgi:hypothetical protein
MASGASDLSGFVSNATWTANLAGNRAVFNAQTNPAPLAGKYTMLISGFPGSATEPNGPGYGTVSVAKNGTVTFSGALGDGTKITQTAQLSQSGQWPLYVSLYHGQGSVVGWITLPAGLSNNLTGNLIWVRPPQANAAAFASGFTVWPTASGSLYLPSGQGTNVLGFTTNSTLNIKLDGGDLNSPITGQFVLDSANHVTNLSSNKLSLSFSSSTGSFRGSMVNPATSKPISFNGVMLQNQTQGEGNFLGGGQSGTVFLGQ